MKSHTNDFLLPTIIYFILGLFVMPGCTENIPRNKIKKEEISIVTTTTQVTDLVRRLVGNSYKITSLMGPGVDPHLYKPTARDMTAITTADFVIYHGLKLEGKLAATLKKSKHIHTYAVSSVIPQDDLLFSGGSDYPDPHLWFSPKIWMSCLGGLAEFLTTKLPRIKSEILENARLLETEFLEIEAWSKTQFDTLPPSKKILVTSHDAFRYLGEAFDLEVIALQGISTVKEAGLGDRTNLVDYIREKGVSCLFIESSVNPKAIKEIAKETGVSTGLPLFSDALGSPENSSVGPNQYSFPHNTWSGMMVYNVKSIIEGLNH